MKENDWIVAGLTNSDKDAGLLRAMGLNMDNTLILSKELYLKSNFIKNNDAFKDKDGNFSEQKFNDFYNQRLLQFKTFSEIEDGFLYDVFDYRRYRKNNAQIKKPSIQLYRLSNPNEIEYGSSWINTPKESPLSQRELAQKNKIFNYSTGEYVDYSPNEHSLTSDPIKWFQDIFTQDTLVLAAYDEDGEHDDPITGLKVQHKKGELKLNDDGKYYYETLGGRSIVDKLLLSGFDNLTVDGEGLNKIDFFDSDDKEKSIGGHLMRSAAAIAPLFLTGPVGTAYAAAMVGRELIKTLPMIDGMLGAITGNNNPTAFTKLANTLAGKAAAASQSNDDYTNEHQISVGNLSNLLTDVALLWGLQKFIAQAMSKLKGTDKLLDDAEKKGKEMYKLMRPEELKKYQEKGLSEALIAQRVGTLENWKDSELGAMLFQRAVAPVWDKIKKVNNLGKDASLMYMALVSNTDVYDSMLKNGCTKREAMAVALGSTLGMFTVDKYLNLGDLFFDPDASGRVAQIRGALANEHKNWAGTLKGIAQSSETKQKGIENAILKTKNFLKDKYETFFLNLHDHTLGVIGKSVGEGLEEVSEELVSDIAKQIYEWAASFEPTDKLFNDLTTTNVLAFDDAFNNPNWFGDMLSRYGMNFMGGALGGGVFYGVERWQDRNHNKKRELTRNLVDAVRENGVKSVMDQLEVLRKRGKLGSTTLGISYDTLEDGQKVYLTPDENNISQNEFVYRLIKHELMGIDNIIKDNLLLQTDEGLITQMTLGEARYRALVEKLDENRDYSKEYRERYLNMVTDFVNVESKLNDLKELLKQTTDSDSDKRAMIERDILLLERTKLELIKARDEFNSGENAIDYMSSMLFKMDDNLSTPFYSPNFLAWLKNISSNENAKYKIFSLSDYDDLSQDIKDKLEEEYELYKLSLQKVDGEIAWKNFKVMRDLIQPELVGLQERVKEFEDYLKNIKKIFDGKTGPFAKLQIVHAEDITEEAEGDLRLDWDAKTARELNNQLLYDARDVQGTNETTEAFELRKATRRRLLQIEKAGEINKRNNLAALREVENIIESSGGLLDAATKRQLLLMCDARQIDVAREEIAKGQLTKISKYGTVNIESILSKLEGDLSNWEQIADQIKEDMSIAQDASLLTLFITAAKRLHKLAVNLNKDQTNDILPSLQEYTQLFVEESALHNKNVLDWLTKLNVLTDGEVDKDKLGLLVQDTFIKVLKLQGKSDDEIRDALITYKLNKGALGSETNSAALRDVLRLVGLTDDEINNGEFNSDRLIDSVINMSDDAIANLNKSLKYTDPNKVFNNEEDRTERILLLQEYINSQIGDDDDAGIRDESLEEIIKFNDDGTVDWNTTESSLFLVNGYDLRDQFKTPNVDAGLEYLNNYLTKNAEDFFDVYKESDIYKQQHEDLNDNIQNKLNYIRAQIQTNEIWQYSDKLLHYTPKENPIIEIVKKLALGLNRDYNNVELLLETLTTVFASKERGLFTLSNEQMQALEEADELLQLALTFLWSTYRSANLEYPYPHNELYNKVVKDHNLNLDELPVIDDTVAQSYWLLMLMLRLQIGLPDSHVPEGFTRGSLRYWHQKNAVNKSQKLINAETATTEARLELIDSLKESIKKTEFSIGTKTYNVDLFEGVSAIKDDDNDIRLFKIELKIHENFEKLLTENPELTIGLIMDASGLSTLISSRQDLLLEQLVSDLHENIKVSDFTPLDKGLYFAKLMGIDPSEILATLNEFKNLHANLAPLDVLAQCLGSMMAYGKSTETVKRFNETLEWLYKCSGFNDNQRYLCYGLFIAGNGGAGKSDVIIRGACEYYDDDSVLISGPTDNQISRLKDLKTKATAITIDEMVKNMLGGEANYAALTEAVNSGEKADIWLRTIKPRNNGPEEASVFKNINVLQDIKTRAIIIDEATHIPLWKLSVISEYAKKFNIPLHLIGDNFLNGHIAANKMQQNVNSEFMFIARLPRLSITLRDANQLKWDNILAMVDNLKQITQIPYNIPEVERNSRMQFAIQEFKRISLTYYNGTVINGDMLVDDLDSVILSKIDMSEEVLPNGTKKPSTIAYVGSNSARLSMLKDKFGDKVVQFENESLIQGSEFTNIIIDVNWEGINTSSPEANCNSLGNFLRRFYTLSTRGKRAAIFIDNNSLSNIIPKDNWKQVKYLNTVTNFDQKAIDKFLAHFEEKYAKLDIPTETPTHAQSLESSTSSSATSGTGGTGGARMDIPIDLDDDTTRFDIDLELSAIESDVIRGIDPKDTIADIIRFDNDYIPDEEENVSELPDVHEARVYGDVTLAGMPISYDPATHKRVYYPNLSGDSLTDLNIFVTSEDPIADDATIKLYVDKLRDLKSVLLYRSRYRQEIAPGEYNLIEGFPDGILENTGGIISLETYEALLNNDFSLYLAPDGVDVSQFGLKIQVGKYNDETDRHVGLTGFKGQVKNKDGSLDNKMEIGDNKLVFKLVAVFPRIDGKVCKVTIGLLADYLRFENESSKKLKDRLRVYQLELLKIIAGTSKYKNHDINDSKQTLQYVTNYLNELDNITKTYSLHMRTLENLWLQLNNGKVGTANTEDLIVDMPGILQTGSTQVTSYKANEEQRTVYRLSKFGDTDTNPTISENYDGLMVSNALLYTPADNKSTTGDKVCGRAVIFVTYRTDLKTDELMIQLWKSEKHSRVKTVRRILLDNLGVSLSQLANNDLIEKVLKTANNKDNIGFGYDRYPFETLYTGIRQLVALHNFRANLLLFLTAYTDAKNNELLLKGYSDEQIEAGLKQFYDVRRELEESLPPETKNIDIAESVLEDAIKSKLGIDSLKLYQAIKRFNDSLDLRIRLFRLGSGGGKNGTHRQWIIRKVELSKDNPFYTKKQLEDGIYDIHITPSAIIRFSKILDSLFSLNFLGGIVLILRPVKGEDGKTILETVKAGDVIESNGKANIARYVTDVWKNNIMTAPIAIHEVLDPNISAEDALKIISRSNIVAIPHLLAKVTQRSIAWGHTVKDGSDYYFENSEEHPGENGETTGHRVKVIKDNLSKMTVKKYAKTGEETKKVVLELELNLDELVSFGKTDNPDEITLAKLLELCFHGTTDEFIETKLHKKGRKLPNGDIVYDHLVALATDAYFKNGFYIDPKFEVGYTLEGHPDYKRVVSRNTSMLGTRLRFGLPYTYFSFEPKSATEATKQFASKTVLTAELQFYLRYMDKAQDLAEMFNTDITKIEKESALFKLLVLEFNLENLQNAGINFGYLGNLPNIVTAIYHDDDKKERVIVSIDVNKIVEGNPEIALEILRIPDPKPLIETTNKTEEDLNKTMKLLFELISSKETILQTGLDINQSHIDFLRLLFTVTTTNEDEEQIIVKVDDDLIVSNDEFYNLYTNIKDTIFNGEDENGFELFKLLLLDYVKPYLLKHYDLFINPITGEQLTIDDLDDIDIEDILLQMYLQIGDYMDRIEETVNECFK